MGGPKTKQSSTSSTTNTFGFQAPPDTADVQAMRDFKFQSDPRIGYTYGRQRNQAHESFQSPTGGYTTPQLRDATLRASDEDSAQNEAQAYREENYGRQAIDYGRLADIAQMTAPRMVQTSGSTTGTGTSQTSDPLGRVMQGASIGLAAF